MAEMIQTKMNNPPNKTMKNIAAKSCANIVAVSCKKEIMAI
jgi:hypothetical protein